MEAIKKIGFLGLGRIGLPQSLVFANKGFHVLGFDINPLNIQKLKEKQLPFQEPALTEYLEATLDSSFFPHVFEEQSHSKLSEVDAIVFAIGTQVPTASTCLTTHPFNLSPHFAIIDKLFRAGLKKGVVIIFRTTFPLGSVDRIKYHIEKIHHLKEGVDFHLSFVPERLMEGRAIIEEETLPKIIGCYNDLAFRLTKSLYEQIGGSIIRVDNPLSAEFCKLTDNAFRNTLFSFSNELAMYAGEQGINIHSIIQAVNHGYTRNNLPTPGFVSGYCLGKDPYVFEQGFLDKFPERNFQSLWYYGRKTNDYLVQYVIQKVLSRITINTNTRLSILGLSFKEDVDDFRMSHTFTIIEGFITHGIQYFDVFDPALNTNQYTEIPENILPFIGQSAQTLTPDFFDSAEVIILCHRHSILVNHGTLERLTSLLAKRKNPCYLFDAWNVWPEAATIKNIHYEGLGNSKEFHHKNMHQNPLEESLL